MHRPPWAHVIPVCKLKLNSVLRSYSILQHKDLLKWCDSVDAICPTTCVTAVPYPQHGDNTSDAPLMNDSEDIA